MSALQQTEGVLKIWRRNLDDIKKELDYFSAQDFLKDWGSVIADQEEWKVLRYHVTKLYDVKSWLHAAYKDQVLIYQNYKAVMKDIELTSISSRKRH